MMSREIKFRAWLTLDSHDEDGNDIEHHAMLNRLSVHGDGGIGFSADEGREIFGEGIFDNALESGYFDEYEEWCYFDRNFNLMQYTGLKDKNGVEIYEGDILHFYRPGEHLPESAQPVEWNVEFAQFQLGKFTNPILYWRRHEVIGNIYENPELVNG